MLNLKSLFHSIFRTRSDHAHKGAAALLAISCAVSTGVVGAGTATAAATAATDTAQADSVPVVMNVRLTPSTEAVAIGNIAASCALIEKTTSSAEYKRLHNFQDTAEGRWWLIDNPSDNNSEWSMGWILADGSWCI